MYISQLIDELVENRGEEYPYDHNPTTYNLYLMPEAAVQKTQVRKTV